MSFPQIFCWYLHITSQTYCRPTFLVTELTLVTCGLLLKDFCKVILQEFAVMRSHMTNTSSFEQIDPTTDVTNMFRLKSVGDQGQVLLSKCSFHTEVFDSLCCKLFTAIIDDFLPCWLIYSHLLLVFIVYTEHPAVVFDDIIKRFTTGTSTKLILPIEHVKYKEFRL